MKVPRIVIAGERSGVGKSTITVGILLALRKRGLDPQPFKTGPDFLDPMHHSIILDRRSKNLDTWMFNDAVEQLFMRSASGADISVIEGVMGFYDGVDGIREEGSTAHLSKKLKAPVILVIDARASSRSAGAVAMGFKEYDKAVNIAGVIFNNVGGKRHLQMLEDSLVGIESLGGMPKVENVALESRHLGLVPAEERFDKERYERIRVAVEDNIKIPRLIEIARAAPDLGPSVLPEIKRPEAKVTIGVALDRAFNFYYWDNFDILRDLGAEIKYFSPMKDRVPEVDGLYLGGGYPELFSRELQRNELGRKDLKAASMNEVPIYAECGGMMYACKNVADFDGARYKMAGIFDAEVEMTKKLQAIGYVEAEVVKDNVLSQAGGRTRGHVFHYSKVVNSRERDFAYDLSKGKGIEGSKDGFMVKNTLASYMHLHFASCPGFAKNFVDACAKRARR